MNKQKIYLAGGFRSNWGETVKGATDKFEWIDPKQKEFKNGSRITMKVDEYGKWDLHFIRNCDIVFVYVEKTNPSCIGLACEAGYAKGIGKTVIMVIEPNHESIKDSYLSFLTQVSDITFSTLDESIEYLKSFAL
jgi:nucleoside 2-deoxyribosyltransferase